MRHQLLQLDESSDRVEKAPKTEDEEEGSTAKKEALSDSCRVLVDVAEPPDMKKAFDASLSVVMMQAQLEAVEGTTGLQVGGRA